VRIAETPEGAKAFRIGERQSGAIEQLRLLQIRLAAGGLGAVETDLGVRAVAERLRLRPAASAQCITLLRR
jgi:hypothetical protein